VIELGGGPPLGEEPRQRLGVVGKAGVQDFDRRRLAGPGVHGLEDRAHAALANWSHDAVRTDEVVRFWHQFGHALWPAVLAFSKLRPGP
jgi:hypothetical protein